MAVVVGFISQKGGVGKSTLARALAREAAANGLMTQLADLDTQQGTAVRWNDRRVDAGIEPAMNVAGFRSAGQALMQASDCDLLVLDGPARASTATLEVALAADLVVQPTGASVDDLEPAVLTFHELAREGVPQERLWFGLCRVGTEAEEIECREYTARAGFGVLQGALYERPAYRQAQNAGLSVTETRYPGLNRRADQLIQALVDRMSTDG